MSEDDDGKSGRKRLVWSDEKSYQEFWKLPQQEQIAMIEAVTGRGQKTEQAPAPKPAPERFDWSKLQAERKGENPMRYFAKSKDHDKDKDRDR